MKKTINVAIGGCSFTIDEDAYTCLEDYLKRFKGALDSSSSSADVMEELEGRIADLLKGSKTKLLDTRKTTPGMRIFEKYAVKVGGGYNHRYNLSDGIL